ncbi:DM13 domain-containing protein [Paenarthrobacter sp. NPDC089322]|uniref:DM13 domain-containing protein n=1 Tax=Paenarthrobacter sp. NPDC089322 TaxID=3155065 RepID=UPI0034302CE7
MNHIGRLIRKHRVLAPVAAVSILALVVVGAALFQPWRLFTSSLVDEAPPLASPSMASPTPGVTVTTEPAPPAAPAAAVPLIVSTGSFQSQEHETTGSAQLLRLPDGSHVLRLENLASSDGPDVKVWLSSLEAGGDWFKYRGGKFLDLGPIKATHGNQNYAIPPGTELSDLTTVVLWCDRFSVAFGSAALA